MRFLLLAFLTVSSTLPAAIASADAAWQHVAFGFVNDDGTFAVDGDTRGPHYDPQDIAAFVRNGEVHRAAVKPSPESGPALMVTGPKNAAGLAVPKIITEEYQLIPLRRESSPSCTAKLMNKLKAIAGRNVTRCQATHEIGKEGEAGYAVFETIATGLAAFFIATPSTISIERHETTPGHGWREGDGGVFSADDLNFLWAVKRKKDGALGVAYTWGIGEGTHTAIVLPKQQNLSRVFSHYEFNSAGGLQ